MGLADAWRHYYEGQGTLLPQRTEGTAGGTAGVPYSDLAAQTNAFMTGQARAPYVANLPDYEGMVAKRSANVGSELRGEVPQDVITQLLQQAAERGIATGSPGSQNSNASYLRALGLTSLGLQQQGSADLSRSIADTPVSPLFSPASLFVPTTLGSMELGAARSGLRSGGGVGGGGGYGGTNIRLPGGSLGSGSPGVPSWQSPAFTQPAAVGRTGYFDDEGLYNSPTFTGGMYTGGASNFNPYLQPGGQGGGTSYFGENFGTSSQPMTGPDFLDQLYSDAADIDWSGYDPFGGG